jgi:outer membrane immunogenic protein
MDKRTLALLATCLFAGTAAAQDHWTGFYIGGHLGQARGDSDVSVTLGDAWSTEPQALRDEVVAAFGTGLNPRGAAYGLQAGYRHRFANGMVLGAEFDYSRLGLDDSRQTGPQPTATFPSLSYDFDNRVDVDSQLSLRATLGHATDRHHVYLTGGRARIDADASAGMSSNGGYDKLGGYSDTRSGRAVGAGYEYAFGNRWSLRAEYLRHDFSDFAYDTAYQPGSTFVSPPYSERVRHDLDYGVLRLGVNHTF